MGRDDVWILPALGIAAAYAALTFVMKVATGYPGEPNGPTSLKAAIFFVVVTAICRLLRHLFNLWRAGEKRPSARLVEDFVPAVRAFMPVVMGIAILSVFLYSITLSKSMIPLVVPFWADDMFASIDRAVWVNPQALGETLSPWLPAIGVFYGLWHFVHLGGILWVLHWRRGDKARHIVSFMLTWSLGMAFAFLFSSMGPIFTGMYDPAIAPPSVQRAASFLLQNYRGDEGVIGGGISAFPSMHVAIATWFAFVLRDRGWSRLGVAYVLSMFLCSFILGWHYVVDGLAGIGIAIAADWIARAWLGRSDLINAHASQPAYAQS